MKNKLFLALSIVFLIAVIYDTVQVFQYGMTNLTIYFFANYVLNIGGFLSMCYFYNFHKKKQA
ncbi:MAG TPA: hypothetical protein GX707_01295 [Epulopiscium sp.]|nr:hypothetical protein [Candidatus Epulonipiscium sp.]